MGNLHEVIQTDPWRSTHGAAIAIRPGTEPRIQLGKLPSYVQITRGSITRLGRPTERWYVCLQTGGKWGYGDELEAWLAHHAADLEDARFYIQDEYAEYVEDWQIAGGAVSRERIEHENSHVGLHLATARPELADFAALVLATYLEETLFSPDPAELGVIHQYLDGGKPEPPGAGPSSLQARAVTTLVRLAPERWDTWFRLGELLLVNDDPPRAVEAFERAVTLAPAEQLARVEVQLVEALGRVDVPRALAIGHAARARWIAVADRSATGLDEIARGLARFGELERQHGDPTTAAALRMESIRVSDDDQLASRYYNIACLRARQGQPREAHDWLRASILLDPTHPRVTGARADRDLHTLGDLDFDRILDTTRDVDAVDS